ncbi:MAG: hypothetical protein ACLFST_00820 [Spirochaetia bacterium]
MSLHLQLLGDFLRDFTGFDNVKSILIKACGVSFSEILPISENTDAVLVSPDHHLPQEAVTSIAESHLPVTASVDIIDRLKNSRTDPGDPFYIPWFCYGYEPSLMYIYNKIHHSDETLKRIHYSEGGIEIEQAIYLRFLSGNKADHLPLSTGDGLKGMVWIFEFQDGEYRIYNCGKNGYRLYKKTADSEILIPLPEGSGILYQLMDICRVLNQEKEKLLYSEIDCQEYYHENQ